MANNIKSVEETLFALARPFQNSEVSWRTQRIFQSTKDNAWYGVALAYVSVRQVQDRLNEVMGHHWQCKHEVFGTKTICSLGLKLDNEWIWRSDGAGDTNFEADKGAISDALKRSGVAWGIGRHLYDLKTPFVRCEVNSQGKFKKWLQDPWESVRNQQQ